MRTQQVCRGKETEGWRDVFIYPKITDSGWKKLEKDDRVDVN